MFSDWAHSDFLFLFLRARSCASQLQTRPLIGWLAKSKPIRGLAWFPIQLHFQLNYVSNWLMLTHDLVLKSLRNGCKILLFYKSAQKWAERRQLLLWGFYYYVTWKLKLDQSWHKTTLFTKSLTGMWPDLGGIFFYKLFLLLFDHHPLGFADNLNQNKSTTFQRCCHVPFLSNCVELFALLNIYDCIR